MTLDNLPLSTRYGKSLFRVEAAMHSTAGGRAEHHPRDMFIVNHATVRHAVLVPPPPPPPPIHPSTLPNTHHTLMHSPQVHARMRWNPAWMSNRCFLPAVFAGSWGLPSVAPHTSALSSAMAMLPGLDVFQ